MADLVECCERDTELSERLVRRAAGETHALAPLLVAQAAFYRRPSHDLTVSDRPDERFGSWIENSTILHQLLHNEIVIVDLLDCADEKAFRQRYGVSSAQFSRLVQMGRIRVTIRDGIDLSSGADAIRGHSAAQADSLIGGLMAEFDKDHVMIGPILREGIFTALSPASPLTPTFATFASRAEGWIGLLADCDPETKKSERYRRCLTRSGALPHPRALAYRLAYHACYRASQPEPGPHDSRGIGYGATARLIENRFSSSEDGRAMLEELMDGVHYVTLFHHRDTAALTGAWGGYYGITSYENDALREFLITDAERHVLDEEFSELLKEIVLAHPGDLIDGKGLKFRENSEGILDAEAFSAFEQFLDEQWEHGIVQAKAKLRKAVHTAADERGLERAALTYQELTQKSLSRRHSLLTCFAEDGAIFEAGGAAGGAMAGKLIGAGFVGSISLSLFGALAARYRSRACKLIAHITGYKQSDRDIYDAVSAIRRTKL